VTRHRRALVIGGIVSVAIAVAAVVAAAGSDRAAAVKRYPYTLVDTGTFGGPSSFLDEPAVPIASHGTLLGAADTATLDVDWRHCPPPGSCSDRYVQHAIAWHDGRLADLGALSGQKSSAIFEQNSSGVGVGTSEDGLTDPFTQTAASVAVMFEHGKVINLVQRPISLL
jgi:hypothetical protein